MSRNYQNSKVNLLINGFSRDAKLIYYKDKVVGDYKNGIMEFSDITEISRFFPLIRNAILLVDFYVRLSDGHKVTSYFKIINNAKQGKKFPVYSSYKYGCPVESSIEDDVFGIFYDPAIALLVESRAVSFKYSVHNKEVFWKVVHGSNTYTSSIAHAELADLRIVLGKDSVII